MLVGAGLAMGHRLLWLGGALDVSLCLAIRLRDAIFSLFGSGLLLKYLTCHKKVSIIKHI
jgi:hypothetical protein